MYSNDESQMTETYSAQYGTPAVRMLVGSVDDPGEVIKYADAIGAWFACSEGKCVVVQLLDRPIELYTVRALRSSLTPRVNA